MRIFAGNKFNMNRFTGRNHYITGNTAGADHDAFGIIVPDNEFISGNGSPGVVCKKAVDYPRGACLNSALLDCVFLAMVQIYWVAVSKLISNIRKCEGG